MYQWKSEDVEEGLTVAIESLHAARIAVENTCRAYAFLGVSKRDQKLLLEKLDCIHTLITRLHNELEWFGSTQLREAKND